MKVTGPRSDHGTETIWERRLFQKLAPSGVMTTVNDNGKAPGPSIHCARLTYAAVAMSRALLRMPEMTSESGNIRASALVRLDQTTPHMAQTARMPTTKSAPGIATVRLTSISGSSCPTVMSIGSRLANQQAYMGRHSRRTVWRGRAQINAPSGGADRRSVLRSPSLRDQPATCSMDGAGRVTGCQPIGGRTGRVLKSFLVP